MESALRYSFVPKFVIDEGLIKKTLFCDSGYGLILGIIKDVTNNLGYDKIRK
jgi:hypothetical protein